MWINEYNEQETMQMFKEEGRQEGLHEGRQEGLREGRQEGLKEARKNLVRSVEAVMKNFGVDLERACVGAGYTLEEYEKAKKMLQK